MDYELNMNGEDFILSSLLIAKEYRDMLTNLISVMEDLIKTYDEAEKLRLIVENNPFLMLDYDINEKICDLGVKCEELKSKYLSIIDALNLKAKSLELLSKLRENEKEVT